MTGKSKKDVDLDDLNESENSYKYLAFEVDGQIYATPLLGVQEVVEPQDPKPVPHTIQSFLGVVNIRGQIVGVVDLAQRFGNKAQRENRPLRSLMVFDTEVGMLAALVDRVDSVQLIPDSQIEKRANIKTHLPAEFIFGIARVGSELLTLIDLKKILEKEELYQWDDIKKGIIKAS